MQEARFAGACQDKHAGRPAPSLGWPGERKSIGATEKKSVGATSQGYGAWGPGSQKLGAQALRAEASRGFAGAWGLGLELLRHQKRARASG